MSLEKTFGAIAHDIATAAEKVKAAVIFAASKVPALEKDAASLESVAAGVVEAVNPGAGALITAAEAVLTKIFSAVDAAGAAATANGLNVTLDVDTVKSIQAVLPTIKAAK